MSRRTAQPPNPRAAPTPITTGAAVAMAPVAATDCNTAKALPAATLPTAAWAAAAADPATTPPALKPAAESPRAARPEPTAPVTAPIPE